MKWIVIMAGGSGQRFWPASRISKPKQLLNIVGSSSLLYQTYKRARLICPPERICIITAENIKKEVRKELRDIPSGNIICEPMMRDTAACIGLASVIILSRDKNASMAVLPADHVIKNNKAFKDIIRASFCIASEGHFVTLGITPAFPSTAYGYIEKGGYLKSSGKNRFFVVKKFHEKPAFPRAKRFLREKRFYWNAGVFVWRADLFMENLKTYLKKTYDGLMEIQKSASSPGKLSMALKKIYPGLPRISVDYAVMEKADNVVVAPAPDLEWDDIGSWTSLQRHYKADSRGNIILGQAVTEDAKECIIIHRSSGKKSLVAALGVEGFIIIQTDDAVLVCRKTKDQDIKQIIQAIEKNADLKRRFR